MNTYHGIIKISPLLNLQEIEFLNDWQNHLTDIYYLNGKSHTNNMPEHLLNKINHYLQLPLDKNQQWTVMFCFCPVIKFTHEGMVIEGANEKGQLREAVLAFQHFFLNEKALFKECLFPELKFFNSHTMNGFIDCSTNKVDKKINQIKHNQWAYIIEENFIKSVNCSLPTYLNNIHKSSTSYNFEIKDDNVNEFLQKYFPALTFYGHINQSLNEKPLNNSIKKKNKI